MANIVIVGAQWGDEGKGKIIDILAEDADYIVRYQGGNNAGHTVVVKNEEFIFHLIPSGILRPGKVCVIGGGVVVDPQILLEEVATLKKRGVRVKGRLYVSDQAHVIFPYHKVLDKLREKKKTTLRIGTTGRGIGPCYADKINRSGIRMGDLYRPEIFKKKLKLNLAEKNEIFTKVYGFHKFSFNKIYKDYLNRARAMKPYVANTPRLLAQAQEKKKNILFEGAQGTLLDIDHGTYPFVTSSSATAGGACTGSGISPTCINKVVGVIKAYTTRVGEGPFPTEFSPRMMEKIRRRGDEFGATTGRPRRCGWFDAVIARHSVMVNGLDELVLTKLDVLDGIKKIKICTGYRYRGRILRDFPSDMDILSRCRPIYEEHPGWPESTTQARSFKDLTSNARSYVSLLSKILKTKFSIISVGSKREETFFV